jgi:hypothetical protein
MSRCRSRAGGSRLTAAEDDAYTTVIGLVEGRITEEDAARWIRLNTESGAPT